MSSYVNYDSLTRGTIMSRLNMVALVLHVCLLLPCRSSSRATACILHVWVHWCHLCSACLPPHWCLPVQDPTSITIETLSLGTRLSRKACYWGVSTDKTMQRCNREETHRLHIKRQVYLFCFTSHYTQYIKQDWSMFVYLQDQQQTLRVWNIDNISFPLYVFEHVFLHMSESEPVWGISCFGSLAHVGASVSIKNSWKINKLLNKL